MRLPRAALAALAMAAVGLGLVIAGLVADSDHTSSRGLVVALGLATGWSFAGSGLFAWWRRPENRFGALMYATGMTFLLAGLTTANSPWLYTLGLAVGNVHFGLMVHTLLSYPSGRLEDRMSRRTVAGTYAFLVVCQLTILLFDPGTEAASGKLRTDLVAIPHSAGLASALGTVLDALGVVLTIAVAAVIVTRLRRASRPRRRRLAPVLWAGVGTIALLALKLSTSTLGALSVARDLDFAGLAAFLIVPYAFLGGLLRAQVSRAGAVSELVARLSDAPGPGTLRDALADALGDRSLTLAYWLPDHRRYVDAEGRAVELPASDSGATATEVERDDAPIAAIVHDSALCEEPELVAAAGAAAALALENERLEAELRARIAELRASRARIVEAGYEARRRLERNLHDGAQQRLVSLCLRLGVAQRTMAEAPERAAAELVAAQDELRAALGELRELARGIHPAILAGHGLGPALDGLAGRAPLPVSVRAEDSAEMPAHVEAAAYFVVSESLANVAKYARAFEAQVSVSRRNGHALVEVADDGVGGADPSVGTGLRGLADRVAALDGRLEVESLPGRGTVVRAEIPCAS